MNVQTTRTRILLALLGLLAVAPATHLRAADMTDDEDAPWALQAQRWRDLNAKAPTDFGPGRDRPRPRAVARAFDAPAATTPVGGSDAGFNGFYAPAASWPIIPIHLALLPDGRVMSYGTDQNGVLGAEIYYDIWTPSLGTDPSAHMLLPNTTNADIFCSGQTLVWSTGDLLTVGGDQRPQSAGRNSATTTLFDPPSDTIATTPPMQVARWYATLVALPSGEMLALGGRPNPSLVGEISTPEERDTSGAWHSLPGAGSADAFEQKQNWFYPRAFVAPSGQVFVVAHTGEMYWLDPSGAGTLTLQGRIAGAKQSLPTVMFAPGKILAMRGGNTKQNSAVVIDINGPTPVVTPTASTSVVRWWSNATVMVDGQVLVTGGSSVGNVLQGLTFQNETWNPATGQWTLGATATKPRLYHSNALLLPDGSVLTGGGGSPGPVTNLNVEIYYPPYLYLNDGSGQPAPRPSLQADQPVMTVAQSGTATVGATDQISRLVLIKNGAATHAFNADQRFIELAFTQTGQSLAFNLPANANVLMPGYYMLFAINAAGTPSVASPVYVLPPAAPPSMRSRQTASSAG